jgi:ribonuclease D
MFQSEVNNDNFKTPPKISGIGHTLYLHDIPADKLRILQNATYLYIDTEAMGLNIHTNRLCLVQILADNMEHVLLVQIATDVNPCPNLTKLLTTLNIRKVFHFARFDVSMIRKYLNITMENIVCTRTLSKICRTFTDRHGLQSICRDMLNINILKDAQSSDWGSPVLTTQQLAYAANDVIYLRALHPKLHEICKREGKLPLAETTFAIILQCANVYDIAQISLNALLEH